MRVDKQPEGFEQNSENDADSQEVNVVNAKQTNKAFFVMKCAVVAKN